MLRGLNKLAKETIALGGTRVLASAGESWPTVLLRRKSFNDLREIHLALRLEHNRLLTEKSQFKNLTEQDYVREDDISSVTLGIKRIKTVLAKREVTREVRKGMEILVKQYQRDVLEDRVKSLKSQRERLEQLIAFSNNASNSVPISHNLFLDLIKRNVELEKRSQAELALLRVDTSIMIQKDWRRSSRFQDLPGSRSWPSQLYPNLSEGPKINPQALRNI